MALFEHVRASALCLLLLLVACAPEDRSVDETNSAIDIDPELFVLGALDEYTGGYHTDLDRDVIDTFAAGKGAEAKVFARYLERLAEEHDILADVIVRAGEGGCTVVASRPLKEHLISRLERCPPARAGGLDLPVPTPSSVPYVRSSRALFTDRASRLSYLAGVHLRYREGDGLRFANAYHKVRLVRDLLTELGCEIADVSKTPRGHYPLVTTITDRPSSQVAAVFERVDGEVREVRNR